MLKIEYKMVLFLLFVMHPHELRCGAMSMGVKAGAAIVAVNGIKTAEVDFPCNHLVSVNRNYTYPNIAVLAEFFNFVTVQLEHSSRIFEENRIIWSRVKSNYFPNIKVVKLHYLSFPLTIKIPIVHNRLAPHINVGIKYDYLIDDNYDLPESPCTINYKKNIRASQVAFVLGCGIKPVNLIGKQILVEFRYDHDLNDAFDDLYSLKVNRFNVWFGMVL